MVLKQTRRKITSLHILTVCFLAILAVFGVMNFDTLLADMSKVAEGEMESVDDAIDNIEADYNEEFFRKNDFLNVNGLVNNWMGVRVLNERAKLDNGQLTYYYTGGSVEENSQNLIALNEFLQQRDIPLLYVQAPCKIDPDDPQLPAGVEDDTNEKADEFLDQIEKGGVPYLDLREEMEADGLDHYSMFFSTDHHWTPKAAFWGYGKLIEYMNEQYGYEIDSSYYDLENYNVQTYEDWFLGSHGKRVGIYYGGVDDIDVITPKFPTNLTFTAPSQDIERTGPFDQSILAQERIETKDYFNGSPYTVYTGGDYGRSTYRNEQAPCNKKILVVKDSYAIPVLAFSSLCFESIDAIDLRYFKSETLVNYIDQTNPDAVVIFYTVPNASDVLEDEMFSFGL